jgi:hypothetical protein
MPVPSLPSATIACFCLPPPLSDTHRIGIHGYGCRPDRGSIWDKRLDVHIIHARGALFLS